MDVADQTGPPTGTDHKKEQLSRRSRFGSGQPVANSGGACPGRAGNLHRSGLTLAAERAFQNGAYGDRFSQNDSVQAPGGPVMIKIRGGSRPGVVGWLGRFAITQATLIFSGVNHFTHPRPRVS